MVRLGLHTGWVATALDLEEGLELLEKQLNGSPVGRS
jgi:hypothetical protein